MVQPSSQRTSLKLVPRLDPWPKKQTLMILGAKPGPLSLCGGPLQTGESSRELDRLVAVDALFQDRVPESPDMMSSTHTRTHTHTHTHTLPLSLSLSLSLSLFLTFLLFLSLFHSHPHMCRCAHTLTPHPHTHRNDTSETYTHNWRTISAINPIHIQAHIHTYTTHTHKRTVSGHVTHKRLRVLILYRKFHCICEVRVSLCLSKKFLVLIHQASPQNPPPFLSSGQDAASMKAVALTFLSVFASIPGWVFM